jgi:hypothetical protein
MFRRAAVLAVTCLLTLVTIHSAAHAQGAPPSLTLLPREGRSLSAGDAARLEAQLAQQPEDLATRARLLGYYFYRSLALAGPAATHDARRRHILWLIQHHPESDLAGTPEATIDPAGHSLADPEGYRQAKAARLAQMEARKTEPAVLRHAAKFFTLPDKPVAEQALLTGQTGALAPGGWGQQLGHLYALGIMGIDGLNQNGLPTSVNAAEASGPFAQKARAALLASTDVAQLAVAGSLLTQCGAMIRAMGLTREDHLVLAETLLRKGLQLAPGHPGLTESLQQLEEFRKMLPRKP